MESAAKSIIAATFSGSLGSALPGGAGAQDTEGSVELIDPNLFRACADPHDLPFSNEAGEGSKIRSPNFRSANLANRSAIPFTLTRPGLFATP